MKNLTIILQFNFDSLTTGFAAFVRMPLTETTKCFERIN